MLRNRIPALFVISCIATAAVADSHARSTKQVIMSHNRAVGQLDVEAMIADYADDATIITPEGIHQGKDAIRAYYQAARETWSVEGVGMDVQTLRFEGRTGFVVWSGFTPDQVTEHGVETYIVEDGKIVIHTSAEHIVPK